MAGLPYEVREPGATAHRFYVAMCEIATALCDLIIEEKKQRRVMVERAHHVHLILTHGIVSIEDRESR